MQTPRPFRFPHLALLGAAAVALGGCAGYGGDYYSGPDTAYYDAPADGYYSDPRTTTYYDRGGYDRDGYGGTYYAPAPRYSAAELHDYWYYPAVGCYYDPQVRVYLYFEHNRWVRARELPAHFRPHLGHAVTVRAPHGHPYAEHHRHRDRYAPERYRDDHDRVWLGDPRHATVEHHRDDGHRARNEPRREDRPLADRDRAGQRPARIERGFVGRPGREAADGHGRAPQRAAAQDRRPEPSPAVQAAPYQRAQQAQDADRGRHRPRQDEPHGKPRRNDRPGQAEEPADQDQRAGARL